VVVVAAKKEKRAVRRKYREKWLSEIYGFFPGAQHQREHDDYV
jgi:hypothetical protein